MTHLWNIGFQAVNFLVLLFLLRRYLWKPVRATIDLRKKEVDDAEADLKARAKAADKSRAAYEAKVEGADHERARLLAATAVALAGDREKVLAEARAAMDTERREAREKLDEERASATGELTEATLDVAVAIARKLLTKARSAAITDAFVDGLCERLDALPAAELAALLEASPTIQVATASALDDAAKARLRERLAPHFAAAVELEFVVDDALIAGAELRFPHARLGHSFQHGLAAAREELRAPGDDAEEASASPPELPTHEEIIDK